jgi:hypothetical protein
MRVALIICFISTLSFSQVSPFVDYNGYFQTFYKGNVRMLEMQRITSYDAGDNIVPYIDNRGNFKIYNGQNVDQISIQEVNYKHSDCLVAWKIGAGIFSYDNGVKKMLTPFGGDFIVKDSLIVFQDTRFKTLNVLYKGEIIQLMQQTGEMSMPDCIGENIIGYKDNGDIYRIFWNGKIFEVGGTELGITFQAGTDILCFNDAINKTFAVFDKGTFIDVEGMYVKNYKAGRGFIVYEDQAGNLWKFQNGQKTNITDFNSGIWEVKDDVLLWNENNLFFTYYNGEKKNVCNYKPDDYVLKNNVIAFRNAQGGVSVNINGKNTVLTNQKDALYTIYNSNVLVELFNKSFLFFSEGNILTN